MLNAVVIEFRVFDSFCWNNFNQAMKKMGLSRTTITKINHGISVVFIGLWKMECKIVHYENLPMQYFEIFCCNNTFTGKKSRHF